MVIKPGIFMNNACNFVMTGRGVTILRFGDAWYVLFFDERGTNESG